MAEERDVSAEVAEVHAEDIDVQLAPLRAAIDRVDRQILRQLEERADLVREVGRVKRGGERSPVYVAGRERDLVEALLRESRGSFPREAIVHVFREIISATRSLEQHLLVAYLGPEGTFSHQAAVAQFGSRAGLVPVAHMSDVFGLTERGETHFGVVPVENTIEGTVNQTFDALMECEVTVCGEVLVDVSQNLLRLEGRLEGIERVASHLQPLAQCRRWLLENLPGVETRETSSTAAAARLAGADAKVAAIGSKLAAAAYGLEIIARGIEDQRGNTTRFLVIGKETPAPSGRDLTSAAFTVRRDQAGALHRLLEPFARHGVNLTAVQSRPMKGKPWEYIFFIDMAGHESEDSVGKALDEAADYAHSYKILGSFPRASTGRRQLGRRA